uniref:RRM domain-containing protein n=1 Tax=Rhodosorus marinus TaxID=101924 RepID=A0A7S3A076_9RHOD|mmetsp:Transcript_38354/g.151597  ORF Transcript_38354/g.151597 Transcript_38354/m.151597 type:complete len:137 (+) Transcript_38354:196-606(+)
MKVTGFVTGAGAVGVSGDVGRVAVCRKRTETVMSMKKLFVGGISWATNDDILREMFATYGSVLDAKVIYDRDTGRSRGFGFVTFEEDGDAEEAMGALDGEEVDGRIIRVNEAKERNPRRGYRNEFNDGFGGDREEF